MAFSLFRHSLLIRLFLASAITSRVLAFLFSPLLTCGGFVDCCVVTFVFDLVTLMLVGGVRPAAAFGSGMPFADIPCVFVLCFCKYVLLRECCYMVEYVSVHYDLYDTVMWRRWW